MNDEGPGADALLERAARRVADDETFLASAFRTWCGERLDLDAIAAALTCARSAAILAALCQRPRADAFRTGVEAIAESTGVDAGRLAGLLREAASLSVFRRGRGQQILAAARDAPDDAPDDSKEQGS